MYISDNCNWTPYGTNSELDKQVDSDDLRIREEVAKQGYGLDKLINDEDAWIRATVARQGYGLDVLVKDKEYVVREAVGEQGYGLDILINDEEPCVRCQVAYHGYGLDKLVYDKVWEIRAGVAYQGYGFDKLINDKHEDVRYWVKYFLEKYNLTLEQWIEQNPDKCALDHKDSQEKKVTKNFIYKVNDSNKLEVQSQYDSVDEFFGLDVNNDAKMNTLIICAVDTKTPLFKVEKVKVEEKTKYKFIIDITNEDGDNFSIKSTIQTQDQLNKLIEQTVDYLRNYPQFAKYADDLANCL